MKSFLMLILILSFATSNAATAVQGCGYLSSGEYLCSDPVPGADSSIKVERSLTIEGAQISGMELGQSASGNIVSNLSVDIQYCVPPGASSDEVIWKKVAAGEYRRNPNNLGAPYAWLAGGVPTTIKDINFSLSVPVIPSGSNTRCAMVKKTVYIFCELVNGFDGATCNFQVNGTQTLAIEVFGSRIHEPSVVLY